MICLKVHTSLIIFGTTIVTQPLRTSIHSFIVNQRFFQTIEKEAQELLNQPQHQKKWQEVDLRQDQTFLSQM